MSDIIHLLEIEASEVDEIIFSDEEQDDDYKHEETEDITDFKYYCQSN